MLKKIDLDNIKKLNVENSINKKKIFKYDKYTIRSEYGIESTPCCGLGCMFCIYGNIKDSTTSIKKTDYQQYSNLF